jgi:RecA/RadA recombinase
MAALLAADETLFDILRSLSPPPPLFTGLPLLDGASGLPQQAVVELCGDAGSGKTAVLHHLVARALAASEVGGDGVGWRDGGAPPRVALFDLDGRFSAPALARTVAGCLRAHGGGAPVAARVRASLARVDVYAPGGLAALADALEGCAAAGGRAPVLLALDGVSSTWTWHSRLFLSKGERERLEARVAGALRRLQARSSGAFRVAWTRPCLFGGAAGSLRAPAAPGTPPAPTPPPAALAAEAAAAARRAGGLPALAAAPPAPAEPALASAAALAEAAPETLAPPLAGLVTHRVVLTRLRVPRAEGAPPASAPTATAAASKAACATAAVYGGGGGGERPRPHPGDPRAALGEGADTEAALVACGELRVAVVAARTVAAEDGRVVEMLLALAA